VIARVFRTDASVRASHAYGANETSKALETLGVGRHGVHRHGHGRIVY